MKKFTNSLLLHGSGLLPADQFVAPLPPDVCIRTSYEFEIGLDQKLDCKINLFRLTVISRFDMFDG